MEGDKYFIKKGNKYKIVSRNKFIELAMNKKVEYEKLNVLLFSINSRVYNLQNKTSCYNAMVKSKTRMFHNTLTFQDGVYKGDIIGEFEFYDTETDELLGDFCFEWEGITWSYYMNRELFQALINDSFSSIYASISDCEDVINAFKSIELKKQTEL